MKILTAVVAALFLVVTLFPSPSAEAADWPMLGRDATRNAVSPERGGPTDWSVGRYDTEAMQWNGSPNILWTGQLGSSCIAQPVLSNGLIWVGTNNDQADVPQSERDAAALLCFRERDGKLLHRHVSTRLAGGHQFDYPYSPIGSSPLVEGDRLLFFNNRGEIVCWDISPLRQREEPPVELWKLDLRQDLGVHVHAPIMFFERRCSIGSFRDWIYVITNNGVHYSRAPLIPNVDAPSLVCLNKHSGEVVWTDNSPGSNILRSQPASPLVVEVAGRPQVIVPQGDGWVRSFTPEGDGQGGSKLLWEFDMNSKTSKWADFGDDGDRNQILATPVLYKDRVYLASGQQPMNGEGLGRLVCLDPTQMGDISSELAVDAEGQPLPRRRRQAVIPAEGERAISNPNSGLVWEFTSLGDEWEDEFHRTVSQVAIKDDLLVAVDFSGLVHCLDALTGERYWYYDLFAQSKSSPLIVDKTVYVADEDGDIAVFELSQGEGGSREPITEINHEGAIESSPIFSGGVLYVPTRSRLLAIREEATDADKPADAQMASDPAFWPQWRGPNRDNISTETGLLSEWPTDGPPLLWRVDGLGEGIASVSISDGRVFTLGYRDGQEYVTAVSAATGEQLWMSSIGPAIAENPLMRWLGQRTPTVDEERLYAMRSDGDLVCLNVIDGRELWRRSYTEDFGAEMYYWGICDYPLVDGERLICCPRGDKAVIVALNRTSGEQIWSQQAAQDRSGYVATVVSQGGGVRQYVTYMHGELRGLAAEDGHLLWSYDKVTAPFANSLTPIVRGDQVLAYNGYRSGRALLNLVPDGEGVKVEEAYFHKSYLDPFQDSTIWVGDEVHTFAMRGILQQFDARTGDPTLSSEQRSSKSRNRGPASRIASLTYAGGHLIVRTPDGVVSLVEPAAEGYRSVSQFTLPAHEPGMGATNPVVTGGRLWLRDDDRLFCYDLRTDADTSPAPKRITLRPSDLPPEPDRPPQPPRSVFVPTPVDVVDRMLQLAKVQQSDLVYDLGSGDGRIVMAAAASYRCRAVGYEIDPELVRRARAAVAESRLDKLVQIEQRDIHAVDLGEVDVVAVYLVPNQLRALIPQLKKLKEGARVVSHQFEIPGIPPDRTITVTSTADGEPHSIHLWKAPLTSPKE